MTSIDRRIPLVGAKKNLAGSVAVLKFLKKPGTLGVGSGVLSCANKLKNRLESKMNKNKFFGLIKPHSF
jgi:hypothetical protein